MVPELEFVTKDGVIGAGDKAIDIDRRALLVEIK